MFKCPQCKNTVELYETRCSCCGQDLSKGQWAYRNASLGNSEAQFWLGQSYKFGMYVEQDAIKYHEWTLKAAKNGSAEAMAELGTLYINMYNNAGTNESFFTKGIYWLIESRNRGNTLAINNLNELGIVDAVFIGTEDEPCLIELRKKR